MRINDLTKQPAAPQRTLTYTESLQAKLDAELATQPAPKFTALEWAAMESDGRLDEGWKEKAAAGALALSALGAHGDAAAKDKETWLQPTRAAHTAMAPAARADATIKLKAKPTQKVVPTVVAKKTKLTAKKDSPTAKKDSPTARNAEPTPFGTTNGLSMNSEPEHELQRAAIKAGINGTELAQFMAQTRHESADFTRMKELGGDKYFNKLYDPKVSPRTAKILGNTKIGDGIRYHGRGFIQITGRDNYRMAGEALGLPLEQKPELAATPKIAAKIAVWYWQTRVKPFIKNFSDTASVTKKINPAMRGLQDRHEYFQDYNRII